MFKKTDSAKVLPVKANTPYLVPLSGRRIVQWEYLTAYERGAQLGSTDMSRS